jgi:hypothetical protein
MSLRIEPASKYVISTFAHRVREICGGGERVRRTRGDLLALSSCLESNISVTPIKPAKLDELIDRRESLVFRDR